MRVAIIGSRGQFGSDLWLELRDRHDVICYTTRDVDVTINTSLTKVKSGNPDVIINCAAFFPAEKCEESPESSFSVNAVGEMNVANLAMDSGAVNVYVSSDFVFDGSKGTPYNEQDAPSPVNTYGMSKLAGERYASWSPRSYIVRSASMFGVAGSRSKGKGNFVESILEMAKKGIALEVVNDIIMSPTYTRHAAIAVRRLIEEKAPFGVYHVVNSGHVSWFDFARRILEMSGVTTSLSPVDSKRQPSTVRRPPFTGLSISKIESLGINMPTWDKALREYLVEKGHVGEAR